MSHVDSSDSFCTKTFRGSDHDTINKTNLKLGVKCVSSRQVMLCTAIDTPFSVGDFGEEIGLYLVSKTSPEHVVHLGQDCPRKYPHSRVCLENFEHDTVILVV